MKKNILKITSSLSISLTGLLLNTSTAMAAIKNPAINANLGDDPTGATSGSIILNYFVNIWRTVINLGALILILYLIWGGIDWITSGGDSGKVASARNKMTQAVIGMIILAFSFVLIGFIGDLFFGENFDILDLTFIAP